MIDDTKPLLPQIEKIDKEEGQGKAQQAIYDMTEEQQKRLQVECDNFFERVAKKIAASFWN